MEKLKQFFWACSGADHTILQRYPTEAIKYVGIGATIFFTGIFAWLAAAYALYTVFNNQWIAITAGLVWGLMIFNLDRYIVSSMRKENKWSKEFFTALPRLILALLISVVIAKPLELKVFEKEINAELQIMEQQTITRQESEVKFRFNQESDKLNQEIALLKNEIADKTKKRDELNQIAREEADGTGGTKKRNAGPIYKIKKAEADRTNRELEELTAKNEKRIEQKLKSIQKNDSVKVAAITGLTNQELSGPAARLEALDRITTASTAIWWANWFVILLFIAVETAPVFVKLISSAGPYDYALKVEEQTADVKHIESLAKTHAAIKEENKNLSAIELEYLKNQLNARLE